MTQVSYECCPPQTVQYRVAQREMRCEPYLCVADILWRTDACDQSRWHWQENPCNCRGIRGPDIGIYLSKLRYDYVRAVPITGTWRRDGQYIASRTAAFREQVRQRTQQEVTAAAAKGPQRIRKTIVFDFERCDATYPLWRGPW